LETGVRSFQGIALRVGDEEVGAGDRAAGVLYLNYKEPRVFSDEERRALKNFATYAALSLRNARLLDQVTRTNNAAEVVARVSALEENPNSTLLTVVEGTRKAVDCDAVVLYAFDEATNKLTPPVYAGPDSSAAEWLNIKAPETDLVYKIFQMDEPYIAEKNAEDPLGLLRTGFAQREEIVSCMALPLRAAGRSIGVMFVNYRTRNRFASDDLNNIRLFADQAAVAIRNFQLFKELKKKLSDQKALAKLSEALLGISTLQETLDRAVKVAAEVLDVVHCNIVLRADNGTLMLSAACGWEQEMVGQYKLADDTGSQTGYTIMTRGPVISEDIDHEKRFAILSVVRDHGVKSSMSVPMSMIDGEIIGAMLVHTKEHHRFTEAEVNLLSLVANQTAIAAQRARLYEDLRQTKGLVGARTALAWMGMASSIWGHSVNNHAVTIKDQVKLLMEMLRQEAPAPLSDELLADVGRRAARIRKVADAIRSKVITPPLSAAKVESVQIDVLVRERLKQLRDKESYKPFELTATGSPGVFVHVNEFWFNQALDQLIDNAIQAMAESSHKSLNVDMRVKNGAVEIAVTDTGTGFKPDVLAMLFNKQVEKDSGSKGLGMGLLMVQCIVEAYSGEINVAATGPTGTTMVIRLPYERGGEVTQGATDRFLLVGDSTDAHWRDVLEETLAPLGQLDSVGEQAAADLMAERKYRAVFVNASAVDNFALLTARLRTRRPDTRIVVVTASPRWEFAREAFRSGATDYLRKTVDRKELSLSLTQALAKPLLPWPHHQKSFTGEECHAKTNTSC
jgi:GAF domain-containing protein/CheY-like chemotaxis protein